MKSHQPQTAAARRGNAPRDRDEVLARIEPARARVYTVASDVLRELDRVAPWSSLYYPPREHHAFLEMNRGLLRELERARERLDSLLETTEPNELDETARDEMRFYFSGIHEMVRGDMDRLSDLLTPLSRRYASSLEEKSFVCQAAADVKGKYTSALMSTVASLVGEGLWSGAEVEPLLFPEKGQEAEASQRLLDCLDELLDLQDALASERLFSELYERWSRGEPADLYALADLFAFKGLLGMLLRSSQRRALYSGDYHELRRRESEISTRLAELEAGHRLTWSDRIQPIWENGDLSHLTQLVLELAALMDSRALSDMVTEDWLAEMRSMAVQIRGLESESEGEGEGEEDGRGGALDLATASLPRRWAALVPLLAQPDLRRYLRDLRRAVEKRQALRREMLRPANGEGEERVEDTMVLEALEGDSLELVLEGGSDRGEDAARSVPSGAQTEPGGGDGGGAPPPSAGPAQSALPLQDAVRELQHRLKDLRSSSSSAWKTFRMTERLLGKHRRIPPGMYASACPFVVQVEEEILPLVTAISAGGALTDQQARRLESTCSFLLEAEPSPARLEEAIPRTMKRLLDLLDALEGLDALEDAASGDGQ